jgi:hypothetical protein
MPGAVGAWISENARCDRELARRMSRGLLLNALPREARLSEVMIAAMSLVPYAAAYVADSGVDARRQLRTGSPLACILILPKITRAFLCWSCRRTPAP